MADELKTKFFLRSRLIQAAILGCLTAAGGLSSALGIDLPSGLTTEWLTNLLDSITGDFAGSAGNVLVNDPRGWSIGRGMFNNGVADWVDAHIDEVRISDAVLAPNEFLFRAVPEPASAALLAMGAAFAICLRRRNG